MVNPGRWSASAQASRRRRIDSARIANRCVPPQGRPIPPRKSKPVNRALVEETLDAIRAALEVPTFMDSPPDELRRSFQLIENGWVLANQLLRHLKRISRDEPDSERKARLQQQIEAVEYAQQQVGYQRRDAKHFCRHYLGEQPCRTTSTR